MFVVYAQNVGQFYTGKAGSEGTESSWVSSNESEAFTYALEIGAQRRAVMLNKSSAIHRKDFEVKAV